MKAGASSTLEPETEPTSGYKAEGEEDGLKSSLDEEDVTSWAVVSGYKSIGPRRNKQGSTCGNNGDEDYVLTSSLRDSHGKCKE